MESKHCFLYNLEFGRHFRNYALGEGGRRFALVQKFMYDGIFTEFTLRGAS